MVHCLPYIVIHKCQFSQMFQIVFFSAALLQIVRTARGYHVANNQFAIAQKS